MKSEEERQSIETVIAFISTSALIALLTYQVFARFVLNRSVSWSEELSRIMFVWVVYASICYTAKLNKHIRLTFILMVLPAWVQKAVLTLADAIWLGMNLLIAYQGVLYIIRLFRFPYISQTLGINLVYAYFIVPIGFLLQSYRIFNGMLKRFRTDLEIHDARLDM